MQCGDCLPGTSGSDDPAKLCDINEYCDDNGTCKPISMHPLLNAACPYETGMDCIKTNVLALSLPLSLSRTSVLSFQDERKYK
jgi:hypothetical protein